MNGYDAGNTYCNRHEKKLGLPLEKAWEATVGGYVDGLVVSSDIVVVTGADGSHKARGLDAKTGRELWTFTLPGGGGGAMGMVPACFGDLVFVGGQSDPNVYAVDLRTGKLRWQHGEIKSMYDSATKVVGGVLYINSSQSGLWALDPKAGTEKWHDQKPGWQADFAIAGGRLLRPGGVYGGPLVAFDPGSGAESWRRTDGSTSARLTANDNLAFVTYAGETPIEVMEGTLKRFKYDRIAAFGVRDAEKAWETVLKDDAHYSGLLLMGDSLYVSTRGGSLYRLDAKTGKIQKDRAFKEGNGRLVASSNVIFASSKEGVVALSPTTLEALWTAPFPGFHSMAIANGRLYVAAGSRIVAFGNGAKKKTD